MDAVDWIYNANGTVTIVYADGSTKTYEQAGTYSTAPPISSTPPTGTGTGGTTGTTGTGKKWWEVAATSVSTIISAIFGGKQTTNTGVLPGSYYPATSTANNGNMILIIGVAALIILILMRKK